MIDIVRQQLSEHSPDSSIWLGYGCGGFYRTVTPDEALAALSERKNYGSAPQAADVTIETRERNGLAFPYFAARWLENCVCVVIIPNTWDFTTGDPVQR